MEAHDPKGDILCIQSVAVSEKFRRRGYATFMLRQYMLHIRHKYPSLVKAVLICKKHLIAFYQSCGFIFDRVSGIVHGKEQWYEMVMDMRTPRSLSQVLVDVWGNGPYSGNTAAVVLCDYIHPHLHWYADDDGKKDEGKGSVGTYQWPASLYPSSWMQQLARENRQTETAFIYPTQLDHKEYEGSHLGYMIRWFTPTTEIEFCGHASYAAGHAVFARFLEQSPFLRTGLIRKSHAITERKELKLIPVSLRQKVLNLGLVEMHAARCLASPYDIKGADLGYVDTRIPLAITTAGTGAGAMASHERPDLNSSVSAAEKTPRRCPYPYRGSDGNCFCDLVMSVNMDVPVIVAHDDISEGVYAIASFLEVDIVHVFYSMYDLMLCVSMDSFQKMPEQFNSAALQGLVNELIVTLSSSEGRETNSSHSPPPPRVLRGVVITSADATVEADEVSDAQYVARAFYPSIGIAEDPATGSAHACLSVFWYMMYILERKDIHHTPNVNVFHLLACQGHPSAQRRGRLLVSLFHPSYEVLRSFTVSDLDKESTLKIMSQELRKANSSDSSMGKNRVHLQGDETHITVESAVLW